MNLTPDEEHRLFRSLGNLEALVPGLQAGLQAINEMKATEHEAMWRRINDNTKSVNMFKGAVLLLGATVTAIIAGIGVIMTWFKG